MLSLHLIILAYTFLFVLLTNFAINSLVSVISILKKNNSIADIFYPFMFILPTLAATYFYNNIINDSLSINMWTLFPLLLQIMIMVWGVRLSYRIYNKNKGRAEDKRYAVWRKSWMAKGNLYFYIRSYLQIYLLQAIIASVIVLPAVYFIIYSSNAFPFTTNSLLLILLGFILYKIGFYFEFFGDRQLDEFLHDKKRKSEEKIMMTGLWKYTRHPNYFGEASIWWGLFLISISNIITTSSLNSLLLFTLLISSPILINALLRFVSGVPMLEKYWDNNKDLEIREIWKDYKSKTNAMWPRIF